MDKNKRDIGSIVEKLGITLNEMQRKTSEALLSSSRDVVILSPTGSGKTFAYLLPLTQLLDAADQGVQALVIVPGRELALQSASVWNSLGSGLRAMACYGGRAAMDEHLKMRKLRPQVVFGTPGRLNDHLDKGNILASGVRYLVIDEFDKCLDMGFREEMGDLIGKLSRVQRHILLSATDAEGLPDFLRNSSDGKAPVRIDCREDQPQIPDRVVLYKVNSPDRDKLDTLRLLLLSLGNQSSIVFLNYRDSVERTEDFLRGCGFVISAFHGGLEQRAREDALYKFSNGSANILVSTDLASRGLDISGVDNIIHYHLPENEEAFVHRVGRTARWMSSGRTFFLLGPGEQVPVYVHETVEDYLLPQPSPGQRPVAPRMSTIYIGKGKKDKISKGDIVGFLCKKGGLRMEEIGKVDVRDRYCYAAVSRPKLHQVLQLTHGEKVKGLHTVIEEVK